MFEYVWMYGTRMTYCSYIIALPKNGSGNKTVRNLTWFLVGTCNLDCIVQAMYDENLYLCVTIGQKEAVERTSTKTPGETRTMSRREWFLVFTLIYTLFIGNLETSVPEVCLYMWLLDKSKPQPDTEQITNRRLAWFLVCFLDFTVNAI